MKHATVMPITKKGPKDVVRNIYSKFFEIVTKKFLISYLKAKSILKPEQFDFRQGLCTFNALNFLNEEIYSTLDSKISQLGFFIDLSKAFDTARHNILLKKKKKWNT